MKHGNSNQGTKVHKRQHKERNVNKQYLGPINKKNQVQKHYPG